MLNVNSATLAGAIRQKGSQMQVRIIGSEATGWELVLDGQHEPVGVAEHVTFEEAIDIFAANWPEHMMALDELKCADFIGVEVKKVTARRNGVERKRGSGARFRELILQGKSNAECVEIVRAEFPESRATISDAAWQRAQLRKNPERPGR